MTERSGKARHDWPVRVFALGSEPGDDLSATTTPEERLSMVHTLTLEAWSLTGQPWPSYSRAETPVTRRPWARSPKVPAGEP
jgi:hypothetical protein